MKTFLSELEHIEKEGLRRILKLYDRDCINFSSNDYLNLSNDPQIKESAIKAIQQHGAGSGSSRLMAGNLELHRLLEEKLSSLTGMNSALVFGSGYLTNLGVLSAIAGRNDVIFADRLNHSSLVAGAYGSRAEVQRYRHRDTEHLKEMLSECRSSGRKIIVTDSLFSMDGDIAPLKEIHRLSVEYRCLLLVDEAHAVGVFGNGGGICRSLGIQPDVITGTLSKALGSYGGFAACSSDLREFLLNTSKAFIYSTALPPASAAAALSAVEAIGTRTGLGEKLLKSAFGFRRKLQELGGDVLNSVSQIVPLKAGKPERALELSRALERSGITAVAIRPPTVPAGTSRIRFSITLSHSEEDLAAALGRIGELL